MKLKIHKRKTHLGAVIYVCMYVFGLWSCGLCSKILGSENKNKKGFPYQTGFGTTVSLATS